MCSTRRESLEDAKVAPDRRGAVVAHALAIAKFVDHKFKKVSQNDRFVQAMSHKQCRSLTTKALSRLRNWTGPR